MFLALVGCGFVGNTYKEVLDNYHDIYVIDPKLNTNKISDHAMYDGIILCLPTPSYFDGSCDFSALVETMQQVIDPNVPVLIKSTISIEAWEYLNENFANPFVFSPEFLRQAHARRDLRENKKVVFAGDSTCHNFWHEVFVKCEEFSYKEYKFTHCARETIIAKYAINSFLATKVSWFNQLYDFCQDANLDYESVVSVVGSDPRIGTSHTTITEERAWGGACFPKDTASFLEMDENYRLEILQHAVDYNQKLKPR